MEMYLIIGHDIDGLYFNLLNKKQWDDYKKLGDDSEEISSFLDSDKIPTIFECDEFVAYVNQNNIKLINGDSYFIY